MNETKLNGGWIQLADLYSSTSSHSKRRKRTQKKRKKIKFIWAAMESPDAAGRQTQQLRSIRKMLSGPEKKIWGGATAYCSDSKGSMLRARGGWITVGNHFCSQN